MSIWDDIIGTAENAWDAGTEWVEDKVIDYKIDQIKKDFKKIPSDIAAGFVTHDKLTPELIEQGWKLGIDGQPYNASLHGIHDPGGIYYDPDREDNLAAANAAVTGGNTGTTGSGSFLSQDLRQRTPSGTMYNPDISEYLNSGLFNYTGPGGVPEYTYGQGLRTDGADYGIWGTPTDVPNPYYWGQFGEGYAESTGVADGAISLPPVDLPVGVSPTNNNPNVGTNTTNINVGSGGGGTGPDGKDLTYQETLDYFGLDPVSTTFPGPNDKLIEEAIMNQDAVKETLNNNLFEYGDEWLDSIKKWGSDNLGGLLADDDSAIQAAIDAGWSGTSEITDFTDAIDGDINAYKKILAADNQIKTTGHSREGINTSPANSGLQWVDTGNNPDVGNRYDNAEDKAIAESILGGEAYAQMVYNNDPVAEAIPGLLGNSNDFNLGRPTDSNYVPFEPTYTEPVIGPFAGPPNSPAVEPQFGGGTVSVYQIGDTVIDNPGYATELLSTGEIVDVNPTDNSYTGTGFFSQYPGGW